MIVLILSIALIRPYKDEVSKVFNGLPIDGGIKLIIDKSGLEFEYWKTQIPLANGDYTETWQVQLQEYNYLNGHDNSAIVQLNKERSCYEVSIRLFYKDRKLAKQDYRELESRLIAKGAILRHRSIPYLPMEFNYGSIDFDEDQREAIFSYYLNDNEALGKLNLFLLYEVCIR